MTEINDNPKTSVTSLGWAKWQGILDGLDFWYLIQDAFKQMLSACLKLLPEKHQVLEEVSMW